MEARDLFQGSMPALYDQYLGPMIFAPYAADLAARLAGLRSGRILETAAGTGIVTRALVSALPDSVTIVATDLSQPMLDHAATQLPSERVSWQQADAQHLPFPDDTFDAVVCQFGVMFFPDKPGAFSEACRVLKPGGMFVFSVWDRIEENDFADIVVKAVSALFPHNPPTFLGRTPYGHHDVDKLKAQLGGAGFEDVTAEALARQAVAPGAHDVAVGFCQGTPMRTEIEANGPDCLAQATTAAASAVAERFGTGEISARIKAHVLTARRPGP